MAKPVAVGDIVLVLLEDGASPSILRPAVVTSAQSASVVNCQVFVEDTDVLNRQFGYFVNLAQLPGDTLGPYPVMGGIFRMRNVVKGTGIRQWRLP